MIRLADIRIRPKLILIFTLTGILPLAIVGLIGSTLAKKALLDKEFETLTTIQNMRRVQLVDAFEEKIRDLKGLAASDEIMSLVQELEAYRKQHGILNTIDFNVVSEQYKMIESRYHRHISELAETQGFYDLLILSADSGHIMFTGAKENDLGTNLAHGRYNKSALATIWREVETTNEAAVMDFEAYEPSKGLQFAFFGMPIRDEEGEVAGVLVAQVSPDLVTELLDSRMGMGETGESYLVRWFEETNRYELRSDIVTMGDGKYVVGYEHPYLLDYWVDGAKAGAEGGHEIYTDSDGKKVIVAYEAVQLDGFDWFMISKIDYKEIIEPVRNITQKGLLVTFFLIAGIVLGAWIFSRKITEPIIEDAEFAKAIANGDLDSVLELDQNDELGELAEALNDMAKNLKDINWLKEGKEDLDDELRGEHSPTMLAQIFVKCFVRHLNGQLGALYLHDKDMLKLAASYSFTDREGNFNSIKVGEGMVGQAALEQDILYFSNVTEGAPVINYGVGEKTPNYFMIVPLVNEGVLLGVVLIGSVQKFTELQKNFVKQNSENFAVLLNTAKSRQVIQDLLSRAENQQKKLHLANDELEIQARELQESQSELQAQQEELRVTNEELEEQTKALKESERELQAQQEELRVTNEELEGRTKSLEKQKQALNSKTQDLVKTRRDVERKAKDLEAASKYKSEFLANMSHELRTPLNSILILSELFSKNRDGNLHDKQIESAQAIYSSGSDLLSLINEILDLSKVEAGKIELIVEDASFDMITSDLKRVFKDVANQKGVGFEIEIDDDLPKEIYTDSQRVQQVLRNLLTNAVKFTHKGAVTLRVSRPDEKYLVQTSLKKHEAISFTVKDDGIGIPEKQQIDIFEAFKQVDGSTSRTYGGTGLGLSISKELTRLLGGSIHLESVEGEGSSFIVILPEKHASISQKKSGAEKIAEQEKIETKVVTENESSNEQAADLNVESAEPTTVRDDRNEVGPEDKTLLIIEDDQTFVDILKDFAHDREFKCIIAESGETGLHFADFYKPSAIILDIGLPGIDGWEVMERLKENPDLRHIPVHFMSASDSNLDAMRMGAIGFLSKPVTFKKIDEAFGKIETIISKPVGKLLVVEDDAIQRESIKQLIGTGDVEIITVGTGEDAFDELQNGSYDCMILDLGLEDMSGFDLLEKIRGSQQCSAVPVIIYTGRDLTLDQEKELRKYTDSIIIKGVKSPDRLLEESALFLHRVEGNLPHNQKRKQKMNHNKEGVFLEKTILLVDDDMRNVFALSAVLEEKGLNIVIARNGAEAIEKLDQNTNVSAILMDIMMPVMDGYEAMREIRKKSKYEKLPIIALTAKAMKGDRGKCIEAGANDYMTKPVNTDKLLSMLRVWLY